MMAEIDVNKLEDMSKEEIVSELKKEKKKDRIREIEKNHTMEEILEELMAAFNMDDADRSGNQLKKSGMAKILASTDVELEFD